MSGGRKERQDQGKIPIVEDLSLTYRETGMEGGRRSSLPRLSRHLIQLNVKNLQCREPNTSGEELMGNP